MQTFDFNKGEYWFMADTELTPEQEYWQQNTDEIAQLEYFQEQANHIADIEAVNGNIRNSPETIAARTVQAPTQTVPDTQPKLDNVLSEVAKVQTPTEVAALPLNPDTHQLQPTAQPADAGPLVPSLNPSDPPVGASE